MSKMGQFVFECQEVACELYNEPVEVVKQKAEERFPNDSYAVQTVLQELEVIQKELKSVWV